MTATTTDFTSTTTTQDRRRTSTLVGLVTYAVAAVWTVLGAHTLGEVVTVLAICAVAAVAVYGWLVPSRTQSGAPGTALALGAVAALLIVPAFWSGLPLILGAAAVMIGMASVPWARGRSIAAVVLGALASVAYLAIYVEELLTGKL